MCDLLQMVLDELIKIIYITSSTIYPADLFKLPRGIASAKLGVKRKYLRQEKTGLSSEENKPPWRLAAGRHRSKMATSGCAPRCWSSFSIKWESKNPDLSIESSYSVLIGMCGFQCSFPRLQQEKKRVHTLDMPLRWSVFKKPSGRSPRFILCSAWMIIINNGLLSAVALFKGPGGKQWFPAFWSTLWDGSCISCISKGRREIWRLTVVRLGLLDMSCGFE